MKSYRGRFDAKGRRFGIVIAQFNEFITRRLLESALVTFEQAGVPRKKIPVVWVPGALEVPYFCQKLASRGRFDAIVAIACILRGDTYHFECVALEVTRGIAQVALEKKVPIATGVITADTLEQAIDRAGLKAGNKGAQAALAALEIADLDRQLTTGQKRR
ncbi:MAG TPA: 6,7-dimethyl-8-ribityllumazine synthase [Verrucomicrobiae bacterium]|nr:6,7-dimethyl-8-ribityllumazine synthase [Verrucomicrobiae bacterium]